ncbi:MAG: preprotein translocase subunit SecG [Butyrivibrio sp.]|nr:preprotein translocase subunit SecG [Butyrivibrio sp.]
MQIVKTIITVLFLIDCVVLTFIILMQEGKSAGLGSIAGGAESYWGKNKGRSMEGALVKITKILAVVFFAAALILDLKWFN